MNDTLKTLFNLPIEHISTVQVLFEACETKEEVAEVIKRVPVMFGTFSAEFDEDGEGFTIDNTFYDDNIGEEFTESYSFDFQKPAVKRELPEELAEPIKLIEEAQADLDKIVLTLLNEEGVKSPRFNQLFDISHKLMFALMKLTYEEN